MSNPTNVNLEKMEEYVGHMDQIFDRLYEVQSEINYAYNKVKAVWYDQISKITGDALWDTGDKIERLNRFFSKMLKRLNKGYQKLDCDYGENRPWDVQFHEKELECEINVEDEPMTRQIKGTTVEGIMRFEKELSEYINRTGKHVNSVTAAYDGMQRYWADDEYRRTGEKIEDFATAMNRNMKALEELLVWIEARRKQFQEALEILAQRDDEE